MDSGPVVPLRGRNEPSSATKRPRSTSPERQQSHPPVKVAKINHGYPINYLTQQYSDVLPLLSADETPTNLIGLMADYVAVLDRHESLAGNLGAKLLGPMLSKRFERLFDGQVKVIKSAGKEGTSVTWLDLVDLARQKPELFRLDSQGQKSYQFQVKQCKVEISADDYTLIASGMPQKMIPAQPITDDEEKELGTLELIEERTAEISQLMEQVGTKIRQIKQRIKTRKGNIAARLGIDLESQETEPRPEPVHTGFTAVNAPTPEPAKTKSSHSLVSTSLRNELLNTFKLNAEFQPPSHVNSTFSNPVTPQTKFKPESELEYTLYSTSSAQPKATNNATSSSTSKAAPKNVPDDGPFKTEMLRRIEPMKRGEVVVPPCDRCRRMNTDCIRNLTACLGCTRKHSRCSWSQVTQEELDAMPQIPKHSLASTNGVALDPSEPVLDEELLGEGSDDEPVPKPRDDQRNSMSVQPANGISLNQIVEPEAPKDQPAAQTAMPEVPETQVDSTANTNGVKVESVAEQHFSRPSSIEPARLATPSAPAPAPAPAATIEPHVDVTENELLDAAK